MVRCCNYWARESQRVTSICLEEEQTFCRRFTFFIENNAVQGTLFPMPLRRRRGFRALSDDGARTVRVKAVLFCFFKVPSYSAMLRSLDFDRMLKSYTSENKCELRRVIEVFRKKYYPLEHVVPFGKNSEIRARRLHVSVRPTGSVVSGPPRT